MAERLDTPNPPSKIQADPTPTAESPTIVRHIYTPVYSFMYQNAPLSSVIEAPIQR